MSSAKTTTPNLGYRVGLIRSREGHNTGIFLSMWSHKDPEGVQSNV